MIQMKNILGNENVYSLRSKVHTVVTILIEFV